MTQQTPAGRPDTDAEEPFLPFSRPSIGAREREAVLAVLDSGWLTTGPRAKEFEQAFGRFVGSRHAIAVNSATAGLHLALDALDVGPGHEVIVPTWTFASTGEVVVYTGATPVLVDVDPETLNLTVETVVRALTPRTKAVIGVHLAGRPFEAEALSGELRSRGIALVEDAAHAFPSRIGTVGRFAGTIGAIGVFSFYATKTITTGEGGMVVTDDEALADRMRLMSLHGISRSAWTRYTAAGSWYYEIEDAGFKYNMTDLAAALGLAQLARADELLEARRELAALYLARISSSRVAELIELPTGRDDPAHAWHLFIVRVRGDRTAVQRSELIDGLKARGIGTSVHFIPLHLHPYYRREWGYEDVVLPNAAREFERVVSLPIWPGMTAGDVDRVVRGLELVLASDR